MSGASSREQALDELLDKKAIEEVLISYCRGADRGDADLIAAAYHPDATEDHGGTFKGSANDYVKMLRQILPTAPRMSHIITNIHIEVNGEAARSECYFLTFSRRADGDEPHDNLTCARAVDDFEKRDGVWKIARRRLAWEWNHEMALNETWGRGQIAPDPSKLVRGGKKPNDILYTD